MTNQNPFGYRKTHPEIKHLAMMLYVRFPLSLRHVKGQLHECGIDGSHETIRFWWNRFGSIFAAEIRRKRIRGMRSYSNWQWHLSRADFKRYRTAALTVLRQLCSA